MIGILFGICFIGIVVADVSHLGGLNRGYSYNAPSIPLNYPTNEYIPPAPIQPEYLPPPAPVAPVQQEYLPPAPIQQGSFAPAQVAPVQQNYLPPAPVQQEYLPPVQREYGPPAPASVHNEYVPPAPVTPVQQQYIPPPPLVSQEYIPPPSNQYVPQVSETYESASQTGGYQYNAPIKRFRS